MASKSFKRCIHPCFIMEDDTHNLCFVCLREEHAQLALKGASCMHCRRFPLCKLWSHLAVFSSQAAAPHSLDHGVRRLSWRKQNKRLVLPFLLSSPLTSISPVRFQELMLQFLQTWKWIFHCHWAFLHYSATAVSGVRGAS